MVAHHTVWQWWKKDKVIMAKKKAVYKSYLLRVWRDEENGRIRIRLEEVQENPQILHFAEVDHFIGFLLTEPQSQEPTSGTENNM